MADNDRDNIPLKNKNYDPFSRKQEIEDLITHNEVRRVTLLLLDFDRDFDSEKLYYSEVLILCADSKQWEDNKRLSILEQDALDRNRRTIFFKACEILSQIIEKQRSLA